ncbi:MAG: zinc ABC transporter substrate-binding protein [Desulfobacteraceae bacterium]|nr:MAG: zinc ABC transporter substrate-binding protein [Desulfobacteraceae bacterium]
MLKNKAFMIWLVAFGLVSANLLTAQAAEVREKGIPLRIVTTTLPVTVFTLNVVGQTPGVRVEMLLPPNLGCPHDYDLTPGEMKRISQAEVIIVNGLGLEEFLSKPLKLAHPRVKWITATEGVVALKGQETHHPSEKKRHSVAHDHPEAEAALNGHAWVSPKQAALMVGTIAEGLARVDPGRAEIYRANGKDYQQKLERLFEEMKTVMGRSPKNKVLTVHNSFDYLARDLGWQAVGSIQSAPGVEPSPREMARLIGMIKKEGVAAIITEPQYSDKTARTLARETGAAILSLEPVATGQPAADTYERAMKANLEAMKRTFR